ncbi:GAF domain-containing protein [Sporosarcina luteola]|uniref:GAF domain-containing protein n=1 Tax=Sporosarcina luteola TaxID=582850 RepID=UPI00203A618F|nr:GAF domain-containing protein [Sporosarcina luteola]MCM3637131.1 GAF domain-containing protein [Sporosarcina luteola]
MFTATNYSDIPKEKYVQLAKQLDALLTGESNRYANLSNASALLNQFFDRINWVGFYMMDGEDELVLGPFQGLPACIRIPLGKGVCGTAAQKQETILVPDVNQFPGHIACDAASRSEIVVPLIKDGEVIGVLDIDSPEYDRFNEDDQAGLEQFVNVLIKHIYKESIQ